MSEESSKTIADWQFDGLKAWRKLDRRDKEAWGAAALEYAQARLLRSRHGPHGRAYTHAEEEIGYQLVGLALSYGLPQGDDDGAYIVPSMIGEVCRQCGLSSTEASRAGYDRHEVACEACPPDLRGKRGPIYCEVVLVENEDEGQNPS